MAPSSVTPPTGAPAVASASAPSASSGAAESSAPRPRRAEADGVLPSREPAEVTQEALAATSADTAATEARQGRHSTTDPMPGLVTAYEETARAIIALGHRITPDQEKLATDCPGWNVHDQFAHVVGLESELAGQAAPELEIGDTDHVRNDLGQRMERQVVARRNQSLPDMLAEFEKLLPTRLAMLRKTKLTAESLVDGPLGKAPLRLVVATRVLDLWTHLQDIREAIGDEGDLDSHGAEVFLRTLFEALPRIVAQAAQAPVGHVVMVVSVGPAFGRCAVQIQEPSNADTGASASAGSAAAGASGAGVSGAGASGAGASGRGKTGKTIKKTRGKAPAKLVGVVMDDVANVPPKALTTIAMSTRDLTRRAAGRKRPDEVEPVISGDEPLAHRVIEALVIAP